MIERLGKLGFYVSPASFLDVKDKMEHLGLEGVPFIDVKTFLGWKEEGRTVRKGEKALYQSVSFNKIENFKENSDGTYEVSETFRAGKVYSLFHRSQTDESKKKDKK